MSYYKIYQQLYPSLLTWNGRERALKGVPFNFSEQVETFTPLIKDYLRTGALDPRLDFFFSSYGEEAVMARNFNQVRNHSKRASRLRLKIADLIKSKTAVFFTLTFRDDVLDTTSTDSRHKYVLRWLETFFPDFVANIDFSPKTGREHYHGIAPFPIGKEARTAWNAFGSINFEKIRNQQSSAVKTSKYITKLSAHALKESCGHSYRVIYPRKKRNAD